MIFAPGNKDEAKMGLIPLNPDKMEVLDASSHRPDERGPVLADPFLSQTPIILYGQSIGGAVAIDLASRNQHAIRALILENTFLSLPRLVPTALPVLGPFAFLCHQKWDSASKVPLLPQETPMLLLSGVRDEVVPREHMQSLWELVQQRVAGGGARRPRRTSRRRRMRSSRRTSACGALGRAIRGSLSSRRGHTTTRACSRDTGLRWRTSWRLSRTCRQCPRQRLERSLGADCTVRRTVLCDGYCAVRS
ncbi:hypothetical protein GSI_10298 [Ganoderma sinense ZZ0214-1]|uniref:Serine aminopeptidase S33 domain-containing protein n=1 Tax=Ganoderma sinense ZZ0214-1 TaxID=1077348 RepID=A0A2G8S085_9APHY|nr:hypothetical protein GSI_10298 [Ganoderma sinense ZZ0214-1]